jgi:hypothetical protein
MFCEPKSKIRGIEPSLSCGAKLVIIMTNVIFIFNKLCGCRGSVAHPKVQSPPVSPRLKTKKKKGGAYSQVSTYMMFIYTIDQCFPSYGPRTKIQYYDY